MITHSLAISKASFAASLLKPDPSPVSRAEATQFHDALDALLQRGSTEKIQSCKDWLLKNVIASRGRAVALGKFLVAYAQALGKEDENSRNGLPPDVSSPPTRRKQLHILYLLSDVLHHVRHHLPNSAISSSISDLWQRTISDVLACTSNYHGKARHIEKLNDLISIWGARGEFAPDTCQRYREIVSRAPGEVSSSGENGTRASAPDISTTSNGGNDAPFTMPATHGDESTPFYDLPAANMMPHIIPNSTVPINPASMKPLRFHPGPPDKGVILAVQELLSSAEGLDTLRLDDLENGRYDLNALGHFFVPSDDKNDYMDGESYYGWSGDFCKNMKNLRQKPGLKNGNALRSPSLESDRSPRKRRRYSYSPSSRSDASRSRSRSQARDAHGSQPETSMFSGGNMQPASRSRSPSSRPKVPQFASQLNQNRPHQTVPPYGNSIPPPPPPFIQGFPPGPAGIPIPPRPANYVGIWPPPPPPPPSGGGPLPFAIPGMNASTPPPYPGNACPPQYGHFQGARNPPNGTGRYQGR